MRLCKTERAASGILEQTQTHCATTFPCWQQQTLPQRVQSSWRPIGRTSTPTADNAWQARRPLELPHWQQNRAKRSENSTAVHSPTLHKWNVRLRGSSPATVPRAISQRHWQPKGIATGPFDTYEKRIAIKGSTRRNTVR